MDKRSTVLQLCVCIYFLHLLMCSHTRHEVYCIALLLSLKMFFAQACFCSYLPLTVTVHPLILSNKIHAIKPTTNKLKGQTAELHRPASSGCGLRLFKLPSLFSFLLFCCIKPQRNIPCCVMIQLWGSCMNFIIHCICSSDNIIKTSTWCLSIGFAWKQYQSPPVNIPQLKSNLFASVVMNSTS